VDFQVRACAEWIKLTQVSVQSHVSVQTVLQLNYGIYLEELGTGTEMSVSIGGSGQYSNGAPFKYRRRGLPLLLFNSKFHVTPYNVAGACDSPTEIM
jgi:hypothetical protein